MKVFVSTYAKVNAGTREGTWFDLEDYSDLEEFYDACRQYHADDADDADADDDDDDEAGEVELAFLDTEDIHRDLIEGDSLHEDIYEIVDHDNREMVLAYLDNVGLYGSVSCLIDEAEEAYQGEYANWEEFAEETFADVYDIPQHLINYIDWEKVGRDLSFDYFESNGHYFRNL